MPNWRAWRMAARDAVSSCGPQPKDQPPPPMAQAPNPTVVISIPAAPKGRVGNVMTLPPQVNNHQLVSPGLGAPDFVPAAKKLAHLSILAWQWKGLKLLCCRVKPHHCIRAKVRQPDLISFVH